jgi:hypothetical protein
VASSTIAPTPITTEVSNSFVAAPAISVTVSTTAAITIVASTTTTLFPAPKTACRSVMHIGDSTGVRLWDPALMAGDANTMLARYRDVGVEVVFHDDSGGRSIVERIDSSQSNAAEVALRARESGFEGCCVIMIGTNDAANVAAGGVPGFDGRIRRLLEVIGSEPVLWLDAVTMVDEGPYASAVMEQWNAALRAATTDLATVEILPWTEFVRPEWFAIDGVHYGEDGRIWRSAVTALRLAEVFPA